MVQRKRDKIASTQGNIATRTESLWERTAALRKQVRRRVKRARSVGKGFRDSLYKVKPSRVP